MRYHPISKQNNQAKQPSKTTKQNLNHCESKTMKTTVTRSEFVGAFGSIRPDNFSYAGLEVLFDYLENLEHDIGEEIELDVIGLCCEYSEDDYETIKDNYRIPLDFDPADYPEEEDYREALKDCVTEYLEKQGVFVGDIDGESCVYRVF